MFFIFIVKNFIFLRQKRNHRIILNFLYIYPYKIREKLQKIKEKFFSYILKIMKKGGKERNYGN